MSALPVDLLALRRPDPQEPPLPFDLERLRRRPLPPRAVGLEALQPALAAAVVVRQGLVGMVLAHPALEAAAGHGRSLRREQAS